MGVHSQPLFPQRGDLSAPGGRPGPAHHLPLHRGGGGVSHEDRPAGEQTSRGSTQAQRGPFPASGPWERGAMAESHLLGLEAVLQPAPTGVQTQKPEPAVARGCFGAGAHNCPLKLFLSSVATWREGPLPLPKAPGLMAAPPSPRATLRGSGPRRPRTRSSLPTWRTGSTTR